MKPKKLLIVFVHFHSKETLMFVSRTLRRRLLAFMAILLLAFMTACGSSGAKSPGGDDTGTGSGGGGTSTDTSTDTGGGTSVTHEAVVTKCAIGDIDRKTHSCTGTQLPGIQVLGQYVRTTQIPTFTGQPGTKEMSGYLTVVLTDINDFWGEMYQRAGLKSTDGKPFETYLRYNWLENGKVIQSGCKSATDIRSMFYCPTDDTMYLSIPAMLADWTGALLPGDKTHLATGEGSAIYTIAHEYAHNIQEELGVNPAMDVHATELEADCIAGVYLRGGINLDSGSNRQSFQNVIANADFSGDYGFDDPQHHGTPDERMIAVLQGHNTANPAMCVKMYE